MKKYVDKSESLLFTKHETLNSILKANLLKSLAYEKALKQTNKKTD